MHHFLHYCLGKNQIFVRGAHLSEDRRVMVEAEICPRDIRDRNLDGVEINDVGIQHVRNPGENIDHDDHDASLEVLSLHLCFLRVLRDSAIHSLCRRRRRVPSSAMLKRRPLRDSPVDCRRHLSCCSPSHGVPQLMPLSVRTWSHEVFCQKLKQKTVVAMNAKNILKCFKYLLLS